MEDNEQMDTHETDEDREKKRKLEEGKEGKMTKPNERMDDFSRKADEMLEKFMLVTIQLGFRSKR